MHRAYLFACLAIVLLAACESDLTSDRSFTCESDDDCVRDGYVCGVLGGEPACVPSDGTSDVGVDAEADTDEPDAAEDGEGLSCEGGLTACDGECVDTDTDLDNCGRCHRECDPANADVAQCAAGSCTYESCRPGYVDLNEEESDGCECEVAGEDVCDGVDNDCDGELDEDGFRAKSIIEGCGVVENGDLYCWGSPNFDNVEGVGGWFDLPTRVPLEKPVIDLDTEGVTCAVVEGGKVYCFGRQSNGVLGTDEFDEDALASTPVEVELPSGVEAVSVVVGDTAACIRDSNLDVYCWGEGKRTGTDTLSGNVLPTKVASEASFEYLAEGGDGFCGITNRSDILCWGQNHDDRFTNSGAGVNYLVPNETGQVASESVSLGLDFMCLEDPSSLECLGMNDVGQLGRGSTEDSFLGPAPVATESGATVTGPISVEGQSGCGIGESSLYCWGANSAKGILGVGDTEPHPAPTRVADLGFKQVDLNGNNGCALTVDDEVFCWGDGGLGSLGTGEDTEYSLSPVRVSCPLPER